LLAALPWLAATGYRRNVSEPPPSRVGIVIPNLPFDLYVTFADAIFARFISGFLRQLALVPGYCCLLCDRLHRFFAVRRVRTPSIKKTQGGNREQSFNITIPAHLLLPHLVMTYWFTILQLSAK